MIGSGVLFARWGYLGETVLRFNTRKMTDAGRFTMTAGRTTGRQITYKELTGKLDPKGAMA
jgi:hypothetical protein